VIKGLFTASRFVIGLAVVATFAGSVVLLVSATFAVGRIIRVEIESIGAPVPTPIPIATPAAGKSRRGLESDEASQSVNQIVAHVDHLGVQFIEITDIILLGTVLYIVSLGLYQLFIDPVVKVPGWLRVRDLSELKRNLISVTVVLLGVTFLGEVVDWNRKDINIVFLGVAVALVVAALGLILYLTPSHSAGESKPLQDEPEAASQ
jgi:uncharacterized membrane protein YqhA